MSQDLVHFTVVLSKEVGVFSVSVCEQEPVCLSSSVCASTPHSCIVCLMTHLAGQIHAGLKGVLAMSCSKNRIE